MRELTLAEALTETLIREMHRDPKICAFECRFETSAPSAAWRRLESVFSAARARTVCGCPAGLVGMAVGAAISGVKPFLRFDSPRDLLSAAPLLLGTLPQCQRLLPENRPLSLTLVSPSGAGLAWGPAHECAPEAVFAEDSGMQVLAAAGAQDAVAMLQGSLQSDQPALVLYSPESAEQRERCPETVPSYKKARIVRPGQDATLLAWSQHVRTALDIAAALAPLSIEVLDLRTLVPIDQDTVLRSIAKTHRAFVLQDGSPFGGLGARLAHLIQCTVLDQLDAPIEVLARTLPLAPDTQDYVSGWIERIRQAIA